MHHDKVAWPWKIFGEMKEYPGLTECFIVLERVKKQSQQKMMHVHHLWSSQQPCEKEESGIQKGYLTFLKSISKFSSQGLDLQATLQLKGLLSSDPMHFLVYIALSGYFNRTHFRKVHCLNRMGPENWYKEFYWSNFLSPEVKWANGVRRIYLPLFLSFSLRHSLSPSPAVCFNFFKKNIHIKLNFLMWTSIFRKIITSLDFKVTFSSVFSSNFFTLPQSELKIHHWGPCAFGAILYFKKGKP